MRSRVVLAAFMTLVATGASGCGSDDHGGPAVARPVSAADFERPKLAVFRAFGSPRVVRYALLATGANGKRLRTLAAGTDRERWRPALFERVGWAPNGRRLAFTAEFGALGSDTRDIHVMHADGSSRRRVTSGGRSFHPVWSPDGRRVYFARMASRAEGGEAAGARSAASIWSMRPDGSDRRAVTSRVAGRYDIPGSLSPDGATLAFTRGPYVDLDEDGRALNTGEVWVMRPDGSDARKLAERSRDPVFSPDGGRIAFATDRDENGSLSYGDRVFFANELYVMDADGSRPRRLTRTRALNERQPSWMPGGARIAYQRGSQFQNAEATVVVQANADGSCPRSVFDAPGRDAWPWHAGPAWRPGDARRGDERLTC